MAEIVYPPVIAAARSAFAAIRVKVDEVGGENIPRQGGAVLASNHVSYLDFLFCGLAAQPSKRLVRFMAKKSVFDHKVSGPLMRGMKHIPVDRTGAAAESYARAVHDLAAGEIVGVFPEATISESYELKAFKSGAARLALEAGVPLLPCVLWGSQRIYTKGRKRDLTRGTPIRVVIGEPYLPPPGAKATQVTIELKRRMQVLLDEARSTYAGAPRSPEDTWWVPRSLGGTAPTLEEATARSAARGGGEA
jgi:1-acyl-sn-glycerol-3-phosphate acyltransferase